MTVSPSYGAPRNRATSVTALVATAMLVAMLVAQLFGYEDLPAILSNLTVSNDSRLFTVMAAVVVLAELLALPYLLGMYISKLLRVVSAAVGFGIASFWLLLSLTNAHVENSGLFSTTLELPGGIVSTLWTFVLFSCICRVIFADSRFRHAGS